MVKRIALSVVASLMLFPASGFCAVDNELINLDQQRNELLKQLTDGLVKGKVSVADAQSCKSELDNIIKIETKAKEDPLSSPECIKQINTCLQQSQAHIQAAIHPNKVWLGVDPQDKTLEKKLNNALDKGLITKEEAEGFKQQFDKLRQRESNGEPTRGFEFDDAISLSTDLETFNSDLDKAIAKK